MNRKIFSWLIKSSQSLQCGLHFVECFDGTFTAFWLCQSGYTAGHQRRHPNFESIHQCLGF